MDIRNSSEGYNTPFYIFRPNEILPTSQTTLFSVEFQPSKHHNSILIGTQFGEYAGFVVQGFENFQVYVS
jgi:hypothetical protein